MGTLFPRILLGLSGLILLAGGLMHSGAYGKADAAAGASDLPPFFANSLRALWLIDSVTLITLSVGFGYLAIRPALAGRPIIILLAVLPGATAILLYRFLGNFLPAHLLLLASAAAVVAALRLPASV